MRVLLCLNGSISSGNAAQYGVQIAVALKIPVTLLGIVSSPDRQQAVQAQISQAQKQLSEATLSFDTRIETGDPLAVIETNARQGIYLTVTGTRNWPAWRRLLRGPAVRHLLGLLTGPVLCVGEKCTPATIQHLLICSGGLHHGEAAVSLGRQIAVGLGATVTMLHVATTLTHLPDSLRDVPAPVEDYLQSDTLYARNLRQAMADLTAPGLEASFRLRSGDALAEILAEVDTGAYDLVVIGSHAAITGPARWVGDITHRIVERTGRPVLVVRPDDYEMPNS